MYASKNHNKKYVKKSIFWQKLPIYMHLYANIFFKFPNMLYKHFSIHFLINKSSTLLSYYYLTHQTTYTQ